MPAPSLPLPRDLPHNLSWDALVAEPMRYGLHATVVAPFFPLCDKEDALTDTLSLFCKRLAAVLTPLQVVEHRGFLALMPDAATAAGRRAQTALRHMAGEATRVFAPLRRPAPEAELLRRAKGLTGRQLSLLRTWGYPYLFEEYDFHITLTGPSTASPALCAVVAAYLADAIAQPQSVAHLCLCRQPVDACHEPGKPCTGRFRVLESFPLNSAGV